MVSSKPAAAQTDKKGRESVVSAPAPLLDTLRQFQRKLSAAGGWCFPAERNPGISVCADVLKQWLRKVEKKAGLPKLRGGLWHPYRRMWATGRKHLPLKDVADAGGWKDIDTLLRCYQQPTNDAMLAVMSGGRPVHDRAVVRETGNQRVTGLTEARPPDAVSQHEAVS
jgi:integrase